MPTVIAVDPFRCRVWPGHERFEQSINEESCRAEIDSFLRHGQQSPVLGRPLSDREMYDFEIVCGARRLFVARHLNVPINVQVRELTDQEAVIALDIENRQRKDLSPYERGPPRMHWPAR
jgi:ParB family chromosome partitioning protein